MALNISETIQDRLVVTADH